MYMYRIRLVSKEISRAALDRIINSKHSELSDSLNFVVNLNSVVERLYMNYGDLSPLPKLIELKYMCNFLILLDES